MSPSETSQPQTPDYIVIGQMLDNPEKSSQHFPADPNIMNGRIETDAGSTMTQSSHSYFHPPEYRSPISPTSPLGQNSFPIHPSDSASHIFPVQRAGSNLSTPATAPSTIPPAAPAKKLPFDRITIATKNESLYSGFHYDERIWDHISHDEWHLLTSDITNAAKLTGIENWAAWTTGITTGTLSSGFILVFGPVAGYYAGRAVHRKTVVKAVTKRLERDGDIRSVLRRWNEQNFAGRGFHVWLELPVDGGEVETKEKKETKTHPSQKRAERKIKRRFKIVIMRTDERTDGRGGQEIFCESPSSLSEVDASVPFVEAMGNELRDPVESDSRPLEQRPENHQTRNNEGIQRRKNVRTIENERRESSAVQLQQDSPVELEGSLVSITK